MTLPAGVREQVLSELARRFDSLRWEELNSSAASEMYDRFVKDPEIGGRLSPFMAPAKIRVWIKDGPAKEYRRALEGQGYMAAYTTRATPGAGAVVQSALGQPWAPRAGSTREKPMRCFADDGNGSSIFVIWGPLASLPNLIWHAALVRANRPEESIAIVLTRPSSAPLEGAEWRLAQSLADIVRADCKQVTYAIGKKTRQAHEKFR